MTALLLSVGLVVVVLAAVIFAIRLDLQDEADRWRWLNEWDER